MEIKYNVNVNKVPIIDSLTEIRSYGSTKTRRFPYGSTAEIRGCMPSFIILL